MFLKKLFGLDKDYTHYLEKGDRYLADERYADARCAFNTALEKVGDGADPSLVEAVRAKIAHAGNMLGRLNLVEAGHALAGCDGKKAAEHLHIILELADDAALRGEAERLLAEIAAGPPASGQVPEAGEDAESDSVGADEEYPEQEVTAAGISGEDRVALYFQTLPGDLPGRYAGLGEAFARGCLLNLEGDGEGALGVFEELSAGTESDILAYEQAIVHFHNGDTERCERLLNRAMALNPANPLCNIGLVQLYVETGREAEALGVLERMISGGLMPEQALLMQGDVHLHFGDEAKAADCFTRLLAAPAFAREAAVRLVPLLEKQGRSEEAAFVAKKYAKGGC